jgi:hypothetical protein
VQPTENVGENENRCKRRDIEQLIISIFGSVKPKEEHVGALLGVYQVTLANGTTIAQVLF